MKNLTTPQAILCGFALIALAIASIPYSSSVVSPAHAAGIQKVMICGRMSGLCADVVMNAKSGFNELMAVTRGDWPKGVHR